MSLLPAALSSVFERYAPESRLLQALCFLTSVPRHPKNSTLPTQLNLLITAWGSVSDCRTYGGFRCSNKVEKHCTG